MSPATEHGFPLHWNIFFQNVLLPPTNKSSCAVLLFCTTQELFTMFGLTSGKTNLLKRFGRQEILVSTLLKNLSLNSGAIRRKTPGTAPQCQAPGPSDHK